MKPALLSAFGLGVACLAVGSVFAAPPPVITGIRPNPIVSMSNLAIVGLELHGQHFWPSGPNDPDRRVLMVRRQYMPFQTIRMKSMNDTMINMDFRSLPMLNGPGQLEFMVKIDGVPSNVFAVKIVAEPPTLTSVRPDKIALQGADEARWRVWVAGSRWPDPTTIWINGAQVGACYNYDQQELVWPGSLRRAGKYQVQLRSQHGGSEVRTVEVLAPTPSVRIEKSSIYASGAAAATIKALATPTPSFATQKRVKAGGAAPLLKVTPTPTPAYRRVIVQ